MDLRQKSPRRSHGSETSPGSHPCFPLPKSWGWEAAEFEAMDVRWNQKRAPGTTLILRNATAYTRNLQV
jgi:hypothetical protein